MVGGEKAGKLAEIKPSQNDSRQFSLVLPALMEDTTLLFELHDTDGIQSRDPVRLTLIARAGQSAGGGAAAARHQHCDYAQCAAAGRGRVARRLRADADVVRVSAHFGIEHDRRRDYGPGGKSSKEKIAVPADKEPLSRAAVANLDRRARRTPENSAHIESSDDESLDLKRLRDVDELLRRRGVKTPADLSKVTDPEEQKLIANLKTQEQIGRALTLHAEVGDRLSWHSRRPTIARCRGDQRGAG